MPTYIRTQRIAYYEEIRIGDPTESRASAQRAARVADIAVRLAVGAGVALAPVLAAALARRQHDRRALVNRGPYPLPPVARE